MEKDFKDRINLNGKLDSISKKICNEYQIGDFKSNQLILLGYEDFNYILNTSQGKYFVKIFASFRNPANRSRYVNIIEKAINAKVSTPKLFTSKQGTLNKIIVNNQNFYLCVMEHIDGKNFYESKNILLKKQINFLAKQIVLIHTMEIKPYFVYDSWAISNFNKEIDTKYDYLSEKDKKLIQPLKKEFENININLLPHCLVHGDIINTNLLKDKSGKLFIIDFSVANYYPRIQEIAVLACNLLFDKNSLKQTKENLNLFLKEYQNSIKLTKKELETIPTYIKLAHAMHLLSANYEKIVENNSSEENEYWLNLGRTGLKQML